MPEEKDKKTAVLIFETGRIVLVGINSNEDFNAFTSIFFDFIKKYVSESRECKLESDEKEEFQIQKLINETRKKIIEIVEEESDEI